MLAVQPELGFLCLRKAPEGTKMQGSSAMRSPAIAAGLMVMAGACFAAVNVAIQTSTMKLGMPSSSVVAVAATRRLEHRAAVS